MEIIIYILQPSQPGPSSLPSHIHLIFSPPFWHSCFIHEPLVPHPSTFEVETAIAKLKRNKSPGSDQILAELIYAGGEILCSKINALINSIW
jgi:hypothetical protein